MFFEGYLVSYSRTFIVNCAGFITDNTSMKFIGNILWLILGGLPVSVCYFIAGLLYCVTIIGIPFGYQLWKFGVFSLWPFDRGRGREQCRRLSQHIHEHSLDSARLVGNRSCTPCLRTHLLHNHHRNPIRASALQDCPSLPDTIWQDLQVVTMESR